MKIVLGYLDDTQNYVLHYNKYPAVLEGYSDANWITGSTETKSTSVTTQTGLRLAPTLTLLCERTNQSKPYHFNVITTENNAEDLNSLIKPIQ